MQSSVSKLQIPAAIVQASSAYQMGNIRSGYGASQSLARPGIGGSVVCFILALFFIIWGVNAASESSAGAGIGIVAALIFAAMGLFALTRGLSISNSNLHVYLCERGFLYTEKNMAPQPFLWDQIQVWRAVTRHYRNGAYTGTTTIYTIQRHDGYRIMLNNRLNNIEYLGAAISEQATQAQLPRAIQTFNSGQTLSFASLTLSQQGISNGRELLPWTQVQAVDVKDGYISVKRQGGWFRWAKLAASEVPNLFIFLALVDHVLKQYGQR